MHIDGEPLPVVPGDRFVVRGFARTSMGGATLALVLPVSETMTPLQRALGGAFTGAWFAMFPIGFRLYGE